MNRRRFIESLGAACQNWTWSWSFVNHKERFVVFGAWDINDDGNRTLILKEGWATSRRGRKQPAYPQSREHIRLIEEEGYRLKTFAMQYELADPDDEGGVGCRQQTTKTQWPLVVLERPSSMGNRRGRASTAGSDWKQSFRFLGHRLPPTLTRQIELRRHLPVVVQVTSRSVWKLQPERTCETVFWKTVRNGSSPLSDLREDRSAYCFESSHRSRGAR
jgi:hypothetical protein